MATGARKFYATDDIMVGLGEVVKPGGEVPATYLDMFGATHDVDFDRLEELGVVTTKKSDAEAAASDAELEPGDA
jgi:hypothetical protein